MQRLSLHRAEWRSDGVEVEVSLGDISDIEVARSVINLANGEKPLVGIFHAAGVAEDKTILGVDEASIRDAMKAKVAGACHLHALTLNLGLEHFVLFSSVAGVLGSAGQGVYAAANAYLDAFASFRRSLGLEAISISWGAWSGGMVSRLAPAQRSRLVARGINSMAERTGVELLEEILGSEVTHTIAADVNWSLWFDQYKTLPSRFRFLDERARKVGESAEPISPPASASTGEVVADEIARVLGLDSRQQLDPEKNLFELGLDSLSLIELSSRLSSSLRRQISSSLFFSNRTTSMIVRVLEDGGDARKPLLVPLSFAAKGISLFCVPGILGMPLGMASLADCLADFNVYSFRSLGLEEADAPIASIEAIASRYLEEMIGVQKRGPYHLLGHSFGGKVVFEMARQLLDRKERLERVMIIDIQVRPSDREQAAGHWTDTQLVLDYGRAWSGTLGRELPLSTEELLPLSDVERRRRLQEGLNKAGLSFDDVAIDRMLRVYAANLVAYGSYIPRAMEDEFTVELVRASEAGVFDFLPDAEQSVVDPAWGWRDLVSTVNIQICSGNHYSVVSEPNVSQLSRCIQQAMNGSEGHAR